MRHDLLIKSGTVVDPSQGLNARKDIALTAGKVAAVEDSIPADQAMEVLDATGLIVTPGLIDLHVHAYWGSVHIRTRAGRQQPGAGRHHRTGRRLGGRTDVPRLSQVHHRARPDAALRAPEHLGDGHRLPRT